MNDKGYDNTFSEMDFLFQRKDQGNVTIGDENYFLGENGSWMMDENRKMKNWGDGKNLGKCGIGPALEDFEKSNVCLSF